MNNNSNNNEVIREYPVTEVGIDIGSNYFTSRATTDNNSDDNADKNVNENVDKEPQKSEQPESNEKPDSKVAKASPEKEQPKANKSNDIKTKNEPDDSSDEGDEPTFENQVLDMVKKFDDAESRRKFLNDLTNYQKFMATNTQERQKIADERRMLQGIIDQIGSKDVQEAINNVLTLSDLNDFLASTDDWYSDHENGNPFRKLVDVLRTHNDGIRDAYDKKSILDEERAALDVEREVIALQRLDNRYLDENALLELGKFADDNGVSLIVAHKMRLADELQGKLSELQEQLKLLDADKRALRKELKERNDELSKLKSTSVPNMGIVGNMGVEHYVYTTPSSGFDETQRRLMQSLNS